VLTVGLLKGNISATHALRQIGDFRRKTFEKQRPDLPVPYAPRKRLRARKNFEARPDGAD
jgi:hypothetical protein